jgi:PKD repeat protein
MFSAIRRIASLPRPLRGGISLICLLFSFSSCEPIGQETVVANFEFPDSNFAAPCEVPFTNTSEAFHRLRWDFGNGQTSEEINPIVRYDSAGVFPITLWADGYFDGATDWTDTQTKYIIILKP